MTYVWIALGVIAFVAFVFLAADESTDFHNFD
jgi:hypothetical protein